jgi:hypothetical protein
MKNTGQRTESVYRRYAIVNDSNLQEAARRLGASFRARSSVLTLLLRRK